MVQHEHVTGGFVIKPEGWLRGLATATQRDSNPFYGEGITWQQAQANARAIAAVPKMINALLCANEFLGAVYPNPDGETNEQGSLAWIVRTALIEAGCTE